MLRYVLSLIGKFYFSLCYISAADSNCDLSLLVHSLRADTIPRLGPDSNNVCSLRCCLFRACAFVSRNKTSSFRFAGGDACGEP